MLPWNLTARVQEDSDPAQASQPGRRIEKGPVLPWNHTVQLEEDPGGETLARPGASGRDSCPRCSLAAAAQSVSGSVELNANLKLNSVPNNLKAARHGPSESRL